MLISALFFKNRCFVFYSYKQCYKNGLNSVACSASLQVFRAAICEAARIPARHLFHALANGTLLARTLHYIHPMLRCVLSYLSKYVVCITTYCNLFF